MTAALAGRHRGQRGISLIEAMVALAIMGFGLLGVVGMQGTLRSSADISKQRSEAVRLAQTRIESWRAFEQLTASANTDWADIDNVPAVDTVGGNATYRLAVNVVPVPPLPASAPRMKTVTVDVGWRDRADQVNTVRLVAAIAGIPPELAGSLGLPDDRTTAQRPFQRHGAIPVTAVTNTDGTSSFSPPGTTGVTWVFNNVTGIITSICAPECVPADRFLLSGVVRFATGGAPTPAEGEQPTDPVPAGLESTLGVEVALTSPTTATEPCFTQLAPAAVRYWCAVPTTTPPRLWSGKSLLTGLPLATDLDDTDPAHYKVCRYASATDIGNIGHPLVYTDVTGPLTNQNFLVISAGDGSVDYRCPGDGPLVFINSNTAAHQPSS